MKTLRAFLLTALTILAFTGAASAHYDPNIGRWMSRDPIGESGGVNLYGFIANNPLTFVDYIGLARSACPCNTELINQVAKEYTERAIQMTKDDVKNLLDAAPPLGDLKSTGREYAGKICCNKVTRYVSATGPVSGAWVKHRIGTNTFLYSGQSIDLKNTPPCDTLGVDWEEAGFYHTHPTGSTSFSPNDVVVMNGATGRGLPFFLGAMEGQIFRMDPAFVSLQTPYGTIPNFPWGSVTKVGPDGTESPVNFPPPKP